MGLGASVNADKSVERRNKSAADWRACRDSFFLGAVSTGGAGTTGEADAGVVATITGATAAGDAAATAGSGVAAEAIVGGGMAAASAGGGTTMGGGADTMRAGSCRNISRFCQHKAANSAAIASHIASRPARLLEGCGNGACATGAAADAWPAAARRRSMSCSILLTTLTKRPLRTVNASATRAATTAAIPKRYRRPRAPRAGG